jgi:hypothetical protein
MPWWWQAGLAMVTWTVVAAAPARADHLTVAPEARPAESAAPSPDVSVDVKLDADGFRVGGRVSGERGIYGAWVDGRVVRGGIAVNAEVQSGTRSYRFALDADVLEAVARAVARQWLFGDR